MVWVRWVHLVCLVFKCNVGPQLKGRPRESCLRHVASTLSWQNVLLPMAIRPSLVLPMAGRFYRAAMCNSVTHCGSTGTHTADHISMKIERNSLSTTSTVGDNGPAAMQSIDWHTHIPPCGVQSSGASRVINTAIHLANTGRRHEDIEFVL